MPSQTEELNERALEILRLLADGLTDREIAERVVMTINTVKWYNRQIYGVLGVNSRTQAIARAHEWQLLDETDAAEPAPKATPPVSKHNLPAETTHFIGRKREIGHITQLLNTTRLLTLVGPPGTGKTRLSLRVARELIDSFRDGVYFVPLAPVSDAGLVMNAVTSALGISEPKGQLVVETLKRHLRESDMLLVMDNFEHVLAAAPQVADLLAACPRLNVLATSREPLHLYGEQEYAVQPLELPDAEHIDPQALATCESTALFRQQARAVQSDFELTAENALDVAKICVRLEGLPLAIELAAARIKLLTPQALLSRLDNRLNTLTGSLRNLPLRQQTLRATIDWSYNLLSDDEKRLFARLSVFRGGRSLEAIEAVCGDDLPIDPLDGVESLLNKNMLRQQEGINGEPRFMMLETLQEYAGERLEASGEADAMRRRHAEYFVGLAERAEPHMRQAGFANWKPQLEIEHHNFLTALEWTLSGGDLSLGFRLVAALRDFWITSDHFVEAKHWTARACQQVYQAAPTERVKVHTAAAYIHFYCRNPDERAWGKSLLFDVIDTARGLDDKRVTAWVLLLMGAYSIARPEEYEQSMAWAEDALVLFRQLEDKPGMAQALNVVGELARTSNHLDLAKRANEECLELARATGEKRRECITLANLGGIANQQGNPEEAERLIRASLLKALDYNLDQYLTITNLIPMAGIMASRGEVEQGVRLLGAAEAIMEFIGVWLAAGDLPDYERDLAYVRGLVDDETFHRCWDEGRALSLEQALALVGISNENA
jgi:predicted ATPase/DNA-binding CsgD family transcriptional regulator